MYSLLVATIGQKENIPLLSPPLIVTIILSLTSGVVGSIIGSLITVYYARKDAKKRLIIDVTTQQLLPNVYKPILSEYQKVLDNEIQQSHNAVLQTKIIEKIYIDNRIAIELAPKNIHNKIKTIYNLCKTIHTPKDYHDKLPRIKMNLSELKKEIEDEFGVYLK